jgi:hypothetical protein
MCAKTAHMNSVKPGDKLILLRENLGRIGNEVKNNKAFETRSGADSACIMCQISTHYSRIP